MPKTDPQPRSAASQQLGRYTLVTRLAVGGMGEIFLARLPAGDGAALRVVKRLRPELANDPEFAARFRNEARLLLQLNHGAITQVHDVGQEEGQSYIALEFVDGKDLGAILARLRARGERLPPALALHVMIRVLDALGYAHRKKDENERELNLVHRDVSPANVLVSYEGEVKVIDFGLAKSALSKGQTQPSALIGKLLYMAPEIVRAAPLDKRADLYSAAVVLHELLSGRHPYADLSPAEVITKLGRPTFPRLEGAVPGVPAGVDAVLQRALSVDPAGRFRTADEMRAALIPLQLVADPSAGPEPLGARVRTLFSGEYASERQMLKAARTEGAPLPVPSDRTQRSVQAAEVRAVAPTAPFPSIDAKSLLALQQTPVDPTFVGTAPMVPTEPARPALEPPPPSPKPAGRASTAGELPKVGLELPSMEPVAPLLSQETVRAQELPWGPVQPPPNRQVAPTIKLQPPPPEPSGGPTQPEVVPLQRPRRATTGSRPRTPQPVRAEPAAPPRRASRLPLLAGILAGMVLALAVVLAVVALRR